MLFDSHAHINNEGMTTEERLAFVSAIETAVKEGRLDHVMDIGFDLASSRAALDHADRYPWCHAVVGCHPHEVKDMDDQQLIMLKGLAKKEKAMAIGEIGLDFHYDHSPRDVQREWFRKQIRLANQLQMPIVIHSREADQEVMEILKEEGAFSAERKGWFPKRPDPSGYVSGAPEADDARVLLHCFSGSAELGRQYVKLGATISIAGPVTYKNNRKTVSVVKEIPLDFLLVETDSPYLAPEPMRGRKNMPPLVEHTARKVAEIKEMEFEAVAAATRENARRFYGIR